MTSVELRPNRAQKRSPDDCAVADERAHRAPPAWILPGLVALGALLRGWRATTNGLTFDESYTALTSSRSLGGILEHLRATDLHPPLDYLLRAPLAHLNANVFLMRAPSVVFSTAALALFAWWMRRRGWMGVTATALMAVNVFQIFHGGEVRMYALMQLLGVSAAVLSESWLRRPSGWMPWVLSFVVVLAVFDHVQGFFLAAGVFAVAGLRSDRIAWWWRAAALGPVVVWVLAWGPTFLDQRALPYSSWMPRTNFGAIADVVAMQVTDVKVVAVVVLVAFVAGGSLIVRSDRTLGHIWLCCGAVPFAAAAGLGFFEGVLWDRSLTCASWAVPLALAAVLRAIALRWGTIGVALAALVVILVAVESVTFFAWKTFDYDLSVEQMTKVVRDGDVIAVQPQLYLDLFEWRVARMRDVPYHHVSSPDLADSRALQLGTGARSGRTWVLTAVGAKVDLPGTHACAPPWTDGVTTIVCRELVPR